MTPNLEPLMKIATILRPHGLTLAQYGALRAARVSPLHRVRRGWRQRGSDERIEGRTVERVAAKGLIALAERRAEITEAGARLLREIEGRR